VISKMCNARRFILALLLCTLFGVGGGVRFFAQGNDAQLRSLVENRLRVAEGGGKICSVAQVDLSGVGNQRVLASIDWSGRSFCNDVWLLNADSESAGDQHLEAWNAEDVSKLIVDLGVPGERQLAVPSGYSQFNGARCVATWTVVYRERDGKIVDDSSNFPAFYQDRLRALQDRLNSGGAEPECAQMEADKIERFLGVSPKAGFDTAQRWERSSDPSLRAKAASVFGDIGDEQSMRELRRMGVGDSPEAVLARHFLEARAAK